MKSPRFPQATIVGALFIEAQRAAKAGAPILSSRALAAAVAPKFPGVPIALVRALALDLLALMLNRAWLTPQAVANAADTHEEAAEACQWMAATFGDEREKFDDSGWTLQ